MTRHGYKDEKWRYFYKKNDNYPFCGDAAMNNFPSIKRTIIWIENPDDYKQSWEKMIALNQKMIYPVHGKPFPTEDLKKYRAYLDKIRLFPLAKQKDS